MLAVQELHQLLGEYIQGHQFSNAPRALYEPVDYILSLGGKRVRPGLLLMAYNMYQEDVTDALPAAFAIELFHNFSLLHDDIMDEAPLRRGKETVHMKYGTNSGILSGDVMLIYVYKYLNMIKDKSHLDRVLSIFNQVAIDVCEGQQYDMNFEEQRKVSIEEYLKMIELKTAVLLGGALQIGALIGGSSEEDAQLLYDFGRYVGIAFQLQDDILDTYGDPEKFGKKTGGDIVQNKKTYLVLKTLELADEDGKNSLNALMSVETKDEVSKIAQVKALFDKYQVLQHAETLKMTYQKKAFEKLNALSVKKDKTQVINDLATDLLSREF